ncbi:hypothetical protein BKA70DRAFT_774347 [Coprinopsis sp. MPI-PUGE-AT-0042]|nr:hypothetical protein BKA70DRAFT_774347 [Coprinopsis sp. MPI-PUGE-AT-0042]
MGNPAEIQHGYMLTGLILNVGLLGVMVTQLYLYYTTYRRDRLWIKVFVAYLFLADIINSVFIYVYVYQALIVHFGDFDRLFYANWVFASIPATTAIIGTSVQLFFAWRVRILTRKWRVSWAFVSLVCGTALACGAAGLVTAWEVSRHSHFNEFRDARRIVSSWLALSAVCDALITITLVGALRKQKTGLKRSDLMIDRVIKVVLQTGLLTMVVAVIDTILFCVAPSGIHFILDHTLSKLYTNSLLSSLNLRKVNGQGLDVETDDSNHLRTSSSVTVSKAGSTFSFGRDHDIVNLSQPQRAEIFVRVEEHEFADAIGLKRYSGSQRSSKHYAYAV